MSASEAAPHTLTEAQTQTKRFALRSRLESHNMVLSLSHAGATRRRQEESAYTTLDSCGDKLGEPRRSGSEDKKKKEKPMA